MGLRPTTMFGRAEDNEEQYYAYRLRGYVSGKQYYLSVIATDFAGRAWEDECTLQDLKGLVEDVSPEDTQMLQWVEEAAQCNNFRVVDAEDAPYLLAEATAGAFTIPLRLPPDSGLTLLSAEEAQRVSSDLAFSLLEQHSTVTATLAVQQSATEDLEKQVQQVQTQLQQQALQLEAAQQDAKRSKGRSPSRSIRNMATLSSLDAASPTQSMQFSQSTLAPGPVQKKARYDSTQQAAPSAITEQQQDILAAAETASLALDHHSAPQQLGNIGTGHTSSQLADTDGQGESQLPAGGETAKVGRAKVVHRGGRSRGRGRGGRATKIGS